MDEGDGIIRRSFCGVTVVAPQVHALVQEGDEVLIVCMRGSPVKGNIMENPEIGQVRKGGEGGDRSGNIAAIQQVDSGIGEKVSRAGHVRHVKAARV